MEKEETKTKRVGVGKENNMKITIHLVKACNGCLTEPIFGTLILVGERSLMQHHYLSLLTMTRDHSGIRYKKKCQKLYSACGLIGTPVYDLPMKFATVQII